MVLTIIKTTFARISSDKFLLFWNVASLVTFFLPLISFAVDRLTPRYDDDGNQVQNEDYYNPYENENNYDQYGNYIGPQHWWEFWKDHRNGDANNDANDDEAGAPWWYFFGDREGRDPEEAGNRAILFVYLYTLILFAGLVWVGNTTQKTVPKLQTLRLALFGFVNYAFAIMVLLVGMDDVIQTEGREMEQYGFYGQRSVMLLITLMFAFIQSIVFINWTNKLLKKIRLEASKPDEYVNIEVTGVNSC